MGLLVAGDLELTGKCTKPIRDAPSTGIALRGLPGGEQPLSRVWAHGQRCP